MGFNVFKRPLKSPSFTPTPNGISLVNLIHGTNGQIPVAQTGSAVLYKSLNGDATMDQNGVVSLAAGVLKVASVALTSANIKAMNGAPVSVLSTPGSGKALVVSQIFFEMTRTGTAYTGGGAVSFQYHTTTTSVPHSGAIAATVVTTGGAGTAVIALGPDTGANGLVIPANEGIDITNASAAFAAGTGTANIWIAYRTLTLI